MSHTPWIAPDLQAVLDRLPDTAILALTLFGEARSEPIEGIVAVGNVVQHRAKDDKNRWPKTLRAVCLQPYQFSAWNVIGGERNFARVKQLAEQLARGDVPQHAAFEECAFVATGLVKGALRDRVSAANHYHHIKLTPRPSWAQSAVPVKQAGAHVFYKL